MKNELENRRKTFGKKNLTSNQDFFLGVKKNLWPKKKNEHARWVLIHACAIS